MPGDLWPKLRNGNYNYGFDLEWERCQELLVNLPAMLKKLEQQLGVFDEFLQTLEREI